MARVAIPLARPGTPATCTDADHTNGHTLVAGAVLIVYNWDYKLTGDGIVTTTITVSAGGDQDAGVSASETYTVASGKMAIIGPFPHAYFGAHDNIDFSAQNQAAPELVGFTGV
jgi:hypothetical protein